jgi:hypothetical protein
MKEDRDISQEKTFQQGLAELHLIYCTPWSHKNVRWHLKGTLAWHSLESPFPNMTPVTAIVSISHALKLNIWEHSPIAWQTTSCWKTTRHTLNHVHCKIHHTCVCITHSQLLPTSLTQTQLHGDREKLSHTWEKWCSWNNIHILH